MSGVVGQIKAAFLAEGFEMSVLQPDSAGLQKAIYFDDIRRFVMEFADVHQILKCFLVHQ